MYCYIGQNELIHDDRLIGIFDIDRCTADKRTREYLRRADENGLVIDASGQLPRSFVVTSHPYQPQVIYLSPLSAQTLAARPEPWRTLPAP